MTLGRGTYSPEDNKLRLYADERLSKEDYEFIKNAGFKWAPKQELFVAPRWTPEREDALLGFVDDIEDEDYSPEERAADRAERFEGYRDKRRGEAGDRADTFEAGPSAFGHQNRARAERQALRHDRHRTHAVSQWSKAEYWQTRTAGVISHALHKSSAKVRRGRILTLEAEQRKHQSSLNEWEKKRAMWESVLTLEGADCTAVRVQTSSFSGIAKDSPPAVRLAWQIAAGYHGHEWGEYTHPRTGKEKQSLYDLMEDPEDPCTAAEIAKMWLVKFGTPNANDLRWAQYYELRLTYERAMLAEEGGSAGDADMEPGGFIGKHQIQRVHRSPITKAVVSVDVFGPCRHNYDDNGKAYGEGNPPPIVIHNINVQKFGENIYRAPTDEERQLFELLAKARKAEEKAAKGKVISLINPTKEDAEKLQAYWNELERERHEKQYGANCKYSTPKVGVVHEFTQAFYSANSGGNHSRCETITIHAHGRERRDGPWRNTATGCDRDYDTSPPAFKIRVRKSGDFYAPDQVIVITDKPQKPLPLDWNTIKPAKKTKQEALFV